MGQEHGYEAAVTIRLVLDNFKNCNVLYLQNKIDTNMI